MIFLKKKVSQYFNENYFPYQLWLSAHNGVDKISLSLTKDLRFEFWNEKYYNSIHLKKIDFVW